jgi:hypothetical protein
MGERYKICLMGGILVADYLGKRSYPQSAIDLSKADGDVSPLNKKLGFLIK